MAAEHQLGFSERHLRAHEYCMTEGELTDEEKGVVLDHVAGLIHARPGAWRFCGTEAMIDGLVIEIVGGYLVIRGPVHLGYWDRNDYSKTLNDKINGVIFGLHTLRHRNGNAATRELEVWGFDFSGVHAPAAVVRQLGPMSPEEIGVEQLQAGIDRQRWVTPERIIAAIAWLIAVGDAYKAFAG